MPRATQTQQKTNKTFPLWSPLVGVCCPPESSYGHPISEARAGLRRCMSPQLARSCRSPRCKTTSAFWGTAVEKCSLCDFLFAPSGHRPGRNPGVQRPAAASFVVLSFRKTFACCEPFGPKLGPVAELVGIEGGVVSGVFNLESSGVEAPDRRPRHEEHYHEA